MNQSLLFALLSFFFSSLNAQNDLNMKVKFGVEDHELQNILAFENINYEKVCFSGALSNRDFLVSIQEYRKGKLVQTDTLFDSTDSDQLKIRRDSLSLSFLSQNRNNNLTLQLEGSHYASKKLTYETTSKNGKYAIKDFLGAKHSEKVPSNGQFPILAIITPTIYADGHGSYCDVANSGITPEKLGEKFNIPHYFIIQMQLL